MTEPIRIAIADDHAMFRKGVMAVVGRLNVLFVAEAANGKELLDTIDALPHLPRICILDINMPVLNGYETLQQIKQRWPQIEVLILSMLDSEAMARNILSEGAAGYLLKDGPPEELEKAIQAIILKGTHESVSSNAVIKKEPKQAAANAAEVTDHEREFLRWCYCDLDYSDIARRMGLHLQEVEGYVARLSLKLGVRSRIGLMQSAIKLGLKPAE